MSTYAHRKAQFSKVLTDAAGKPLANTKVDVRQTKSDFMIGCGAFDFVALASNGNSVGSRGGSNHSEEFLNMIRTRCENWLQIHEFGTLPFYLAGYEPEEGKTEYESRMAAAKYLQERGVTLKGHPLTWHAVWAKWLLQYDEKTIMEKILQRIEREVTAFKGVIDIWDVINEVVVTPTFPEENAVSRVCRKYGRVKLIKEVFDCAHAYNPDALLILNDYIMDSNYDILIDGCLNAGAPISCIGIQSHQHQGYRGDEYWADVLDRLGAFGLPMHFTENTLLSGGLTPADVADLNDYQPADWPSTEEGEQRQKEQMEHMFRMLFDHPRVMAITNWNFSDGQWLNAPGGLCRRDGSLKPSYYMLKDLKNEWRTNGTFETDANGVLSFEGFKGEYELSFAGLNQKVSLH